MRPLHINNKLVSVIVPMYNAETTICRCVDSIFSQTYRNIEVILIDDGSKDATLSIAEDYAKRDIRVKRILRRMEE